MPASGGGRWPTGWTSAATSCGLSTCWCGGRWWGTCARNCTAPSGRRCRNATARPRGGSIARRSMRCRRRWPRIWGTSACAGPTGRRPLSVAGGADGGDGAAHRAAGAAAALRSEAVAANQAAALGLTPALRPRDPKSRPDSRRTNPRPAAGSAEGRNRHRGFGRRRIAGSSSSASELSTAGAGLRVGDLRVIARGAMWLGEHEGASRAPSFLSFPAGVLIARHRAMSTPCPDASGSDRPAGRSRAAWRAAS